MNDSCGSYDSDHYSMEIVPGARGGSAGKFTVSPGDVPEFGGGERSEVAGHDDAVLVREGEERWYEFSLRFGEDFPAPVEGSWFIIMQWHSDAGGSPPLTVHVSPDREVVIGGDAVREDGRVLGKVRPGEWVDYALHIGFSRDASDGFVEGWEEGVQTVQRQERETLVVEEHYFKMGIYRGNEDDSTAELTIDDFRVSG